GIRRPELRADPEREQTSGEKEEEGRDEVQDADLLVVGRRDPLEDARVTRARERKGPLEGGHAGPFHRAGMGVSNNRGAPFRELLIALRLCVDFGLLARVHVVDAGALILEGRTAWIHSPPGEADVPAAWAVPRDLDRNDGCDDAAVGDADDPVASPRRERSRSYAAL